MKYLEKSFQFAVTNLRQKSFLDDMFLRERDRKRTEPHKYENGGGVCQLCGMDEKARIHEEAIL